MIIDSFEITDSTTREELIAHIQDQQEEIEQLESKVEDKNQEIEDLSLAPEQHRRLAEAADLMAELGKIHNTPQAKRQWENGL